MTGFDSLAADQSFVKPDSTEEAVKALVEVHAQVRGVSLRDLFRSCYMATFGKDISQNSLADDLVSFQQGITPPYVIKYFLNRLGGHHESPTNTQA